MKQIILSLIGLIIGSLTAEAQRSIHPRVEIGANFTNFKNKNNEAEAISNPQIGFRVGGALDVDLAKSSVYLSPGIAYQINRVKEQGSDGFHYYTQQVLSIPLNLGLRLPLNTNWRVSVEAGPYLQIAHAGKVKLPGRTLDLYQRIAGNTEIGLKRIDLGLGAGLALYYQRYYLGINAQYGLLNQTNSRDQGAHLSSYGFNLCIGFRL